MGTVQSVHFANASRQGIHVIAALNPWWLVADVFVNVTALLLAVGRIKAVATAAMLPETLKTIADLIQFMNIAVKLLYASVVAGTRPADAVLSMIDAFKGSSTYIKYGDAPVVSDESFFNYLNADGIASIFNAETISLLVLSDDGLQFASFDSAQNYSWIATSRQKIVRSRFGTLWQEDSSAGSIQVDWTRSEPIVVEAAINPKPQDTCRCRHGCGRGYVGCFCNKRNCFCG